MEKYAVANVQKTCKLEFCNRKNPILKVKIYVIELLLMCVILFQFEPVCTEDDQ